ncbi:MULTISPECIES: hypothetical protein [Okeania]|nr:MULTISPECIES: hypothetical protein [Okeania]
MESSVISSSYKIYGVGELVYDINLNYLGVRSQEERKKKKN